MTLHMELDAATHRADKLPRTCVEWDVDMDGTIFLNVTVRSKPDGDVVNRLVDLLRKAADAMEVSRPSPREATRGDVRAILGALGVDYREGKA